MKYTAELVSRIALLWWDKRPFSEEGKARRQARRAQREAARAARRKGVELSSEAIEYEVTEVKGMALRTSTGAGLAGVAVNLLMQVLQAFPQTAELATPEVAAGLTAVVMWAVARIWKTPEKPGAL